MSPSGVNTVSFKRVVNLPISQHALLELGTWISTSSDATLPVLFLKLQVGESRFIEIVDLRLHRKYMSFSCALKRPE